MHSWIAESMSIEYYSNHNAKSGCWVAIFNEKKQKPRKSYVKPFIWVTFLGFEYIEVSENLRIEHKLIEY